MYFKNSGEPFSLTILGTQLYILTNPKDMSEAYRHASTLSFDVFVKRLLQTCGSARSVVEKLYQNPQLPREHKNSLGEALHALNVQQSSPGRHFDALSTKILCYFECSLTFGAVASNARLSSGTPPSADTAYVSLTRLCAETVINASQDAYFGHYLSKIDPNLAQTFLDFDTRSWQLLYHYPRWLSPTMHSARDNLVMALASYFDAPEENKVDAAWATKYVEQEMRHLGFDNEQMATLMMLQYWG